jgi:membrane fusion protein, copper/silver efflux system
MDNNQPAKIVSFLGRVPLWILLVAVFLLGFLLRGGGSSGDTHANHGAPSQTASVTEEWICAMHPQVRQPGPGKCPICAMDLIPASESSSSETLGAGQVHLSDAARKLAAVRTAPVERKPAVHTLSLPGVVAFDERTVEHISARAAGRIDRLYVNFTGMRVRKGQRLAQLYSPELFSAQEELLQAIKSEKLFRTSSLESASRTAAGTLAAARIKLELLGMSVSQIDELVARGEAATHLDILAPSGGTVVEKAAMAGMYVEEGSVLYKISNLGTVWVRLSAYEQDLPWLSEGNLVTFTTPAFPGKKFNGKIDFIDPVVDPKSRTVGVRVTAPNPDKKLKPAMLAGALVETRLGDQDTTVLMIPATAALLTGKHAVVYVAIPGEQGVFESRLVELGPRAGDFHIISGGLSEGEMVVVEGSFKIDAAAQIAAKPSMMNPDGVGSGHAMKQGHFSLTAETHKQISYPVDQSSLPDSFTEGLESLYASYIAVQEALADDKFAEVTKATGAFSRALDAVDFSGLPTAGQLLWQTLHNELSTTLNKVVSVDGIKTARKHFEPLSNSMIETVKIFGGQGDEPLVLFHCPMAIDNKGAQWLQNDGEARNPYFGSVMLRCRDRVETLFAGGQGN